MSYFGFGDREGLEQQFSIERDPTIEILFAWYSYENYSGHAFVLFRDQDGALFEVGGSHCSCYGLEGQWCPELVDLDELRLRVARKETQYGGDWYKWNGDMPDEARRELVEVLNEATQD